MAVEDIASKLLAKMQRFSETGDTLPAAFLKIVNKDLIQNANEEDGEVMSDEESDRVDLSRVKQESSEHQDNHVDMSRVKREIYEDDDASQASNENQRHDDRANLYRTKRKSNVPCDEEYESTSPIKHGKKNGDERNGSYVKKHRGYYLRESSSPVKYTSKDYDDRVNLYRTKHRKTEHGYEHFSKRRGNQNYDVEKDSMLSKRHSQHDDRGEFSRKRYQANRRYDDFKETRTSPVNPPLKSMKKFSNLVCKFYREGCCRDTADVCQYSHNVFESHRLAELCPLYISGSCRQGLTCKYLHGEYPCKDFYLGRCQVPNCRFSHEPLNRFTKSLFERDVRLEQAAMKSISAPPQRKTLLKNATPKPLIEPLMSKPVKPLSNYPLQRRRSFNTKPSFRQSSAPYSTTSPRRRPLLALPTERPLEEVLSSVAFNIPKLLHSG